MTDQYEDVRQFLRNLSPEQRAEHELKGSIIRTITDSFLNVQLPADLTVNEQTIVLSSGILDAVQALSLEDRDRINFLLMVTADLLRRHLAAFGVDGYEADDEAAAPAGPHPYQEFNEFDNTCHYPGCELVIDDHPDRM